MRRRRRGGARRAACNLSPSGAEGETLRLAERDARRLRAAARRSCTAARRYDVRLPLLGAYQASNALVAAGLAIAAGRGCRRACSARWNTDRRQGPARDRRRERNGGLAVVDYAHKPEALAAALDALRPFATRQAHLRVRLRRRPRPGQAADHGRASPSSRPTSSSSPTTTRAARAPAAIRAEILASAPGAREIGDRAEAIAAGVAMLGPGDVVLVAGKGHETGQIVGDRVLPFSDHEALQAALERT